MAKARPRVEPSRFSVAELKQHANRLNLLSKDAARACDFLDTLSEIHQAGNLDPKGVLHDALMTAAVVVYARSFTGNKGADGNAVARACIDLLPVSREKSLMDLHQQILDARNEAVAHSDWHRRSTQVVDNELPGSLRWTSMAAGWEQIREGHFRQLAFRVWDEARQMVCRIDRGEHPFAQ